MWLQYVSHHIAEQLYKAGGPKCILDLGMGTGRVGYMIKTDYPEVETHIVGCEVHKPFIEYAKQLGNAYDEILELDVGTQHIPYPDRHFDIGLALGVIAHLPKENGYFMLSELERVCRYIILTTIAGEPSLYVFNVPRGKASKEEEALEHKSTWSAGEFRRRGYKVRGFFLKWHQKKSTFLDTALMPVTFLLPSIARIIVAVKSTTQSL